MAKNSRIEAIERATSRTWEEWLRFMDKIDATHLDHHAIATKVLYDLMDGIDNPGWWAQAVTVAYEQYVGRRVPGQRPDGTFQMSISKATKCGMQELMDKWTAFAAKDKAVLDIIVGDVRVSGTDNRITWRAKAKDGPSITIISEPKSSDTASIVVQCLGVRTAALKDRAKKAWAAIIERFLADL
jgi:hypothetical protein